MWWVEHGPLAGGRPERRAWSHSGHPSYDAALRWAETRIKEGVVVREITGPDARVLMNEAEIARRFGHPR